MKFRCPHCGKEIKEVSVLEFTWKKLLVCAGLGVGCGLIVYPLMPGFYGAIGAFLVGFVVVFLATMEKK